MNIDKLLRSAMRPSHWSTMMKAVLPTTEHGPPLASITPSTIIDVGANKGQFSSFAHTQWPAAKIIAFEPIPNQAEKYRQVMGDRALLHQCALASTAGEMTLHIASRADSSSLLPLGDRQKSTFHMDEVGTLQVPVRRLDEVLGASHIATPALLKIDVQGFEYEVLEGMSKISDYITWIYVEASFQELYTGQKLYPEIQSLVEKMGFQFISKSNIAYDEDGRELQADVLFYETINHIEKPREFFSTILYFFLIQFSKGPMFSKISKTLIQFTKPFRYRVDNFLYARSSEGEHIASLKDCYKGQPLLIVGNGPSLNKTPLEKFSDIPCIGMNKIDLLYSRTRWRPTLVMCTNNIVVKQNSDEFSRSGIPTYIAWKARWFVRQGSKNIYYFNTLDDDSFQTEAEKGFGSGATVTYAALQLAFYMGASPVIIVGVDHSFDKVAGHGV